MDMQSFPLSPTTLEDAGLRPEPIRRLEAMIETHIAEGHHPGASFAIARHGKLLVERTFGKATLGGAADADTLWLMYSNTKVVTAAAVWSLFEDGALRFTDKVSDFVPEFGKHGKQDITLLQVITHRAGYPSAMVPPESRLDHQKLREVVCDFTLEWTPGSRMHYHGSAAHWTLAVVMEAITGKDFRDVIRARVTAPLGLSDEIFVGVPESAMARCADMHEPAEGAGVQPIAETNSAAHRAAGVPGGGGYATARAMAAFYQMMLQGGELNGKKLFSRRTLEYAIRDWTGDMVDGNQGVPMNRGLGPYLRGTKPGSSHGAIASPTTFGHGGAGSSQCWGDPESGVSFAFFSNTRKPEAWHGRRMDTLSSFVHAALS
jgi:CubicO group peptidase (beta-lactamase class C family)